MVNIFVDRQIQFLLKKLIGILNPDESVFLVGGFVRDLYLNRKNYDVDLAVQGNVRKIARRFADAIGAPFFMLNESFDTARIVWSVSSSAKMNIDLVGLRGNSIEADLRKRDFTMNALAINVRQLNEIIDPIQGRQDIRSKLIRSCSETTFKDDPLRVLRAIRQSVLFGYQIEDQTLSDLKKAIGTMRSVSHERLRDELFKLFDVDNPATALNALNHLGIISQVFFEIKDLLAYQVATVPRESVWAHTLQVIQNLRLLFKVLVGAYQDEGAGELQSGKAVLQLGRFRHTLEGYFQQNLSGDRSKKTLLYYCALLHDVGKKDAATIREDGSVSYRGHAEIAAAISEKIAVRLALSNAEIRWAGLIIKNHVDIHQAANDAGQVNPRWVYHFIKKNKDAGIGLVLFSLADCLAHQYELGFEARYEKELKISRTILDAYFGEDNRLRNPPKYLDGEQVMALTGLEPGPKLGEVLNKLAEETAIGDVGSLDDAMRFVKRIVNLI